jgi:translocator protein
MPRALQLLISVTLPFLAGFIGGLLSTPHLATWYAGLEKPFFAPPTWVFGPVWAMLYVLIGMSFFLVWTAPYKESKTWAYVAFGAQLFLQMLWPAVFFGLHAPEAGVVIILVLLGTLIGMMRIFWPISRTAAYLLVLPVVWVSFALALNIAIAALN